MRMAKTELKQVACYTEESIEHRSFSIHSPYTISHNERQHSNNIYTLITHTNI